MGGSNQEFGGAADAQRPGINLDTLVNVVAAATVSANNKLAQIKLNASSVSIADMFDMQMLMNHLSQLSEMATAMVNAANQAVNSMARNIKG